MWEKAATAEASKRLPVSKIIRRRKAQGRHVIVFFCFLKSLHMCSKVREVQVPPSQGEGGCEEATKREEGAF